MLFKQKFLIFQFIKLASSFNTFHTKLSKAKKKGKEGILLRNKWKQGAFFFSKLWLVVIISSNHGTSYMEN